MRFSTGLVCFVFAVSARGQWEMQNSGTTASLRGIDNVGGGVAWASGTGGTVLKTVDSGKHWDHCAVPPDAEKLDFRGVQAFDDKTAIVMASGKGNLSRLYKTVDGCATWKLVLTNPDKDGFFDGLNFLSISNAANHQLSVDHAEGVLLGDPVNGEFVIFQTVDGGTTWTKRVSAQRGKSSNCQIDTFAAAEGEAAFAASNQSLIRFHPYLFFFVTGGMKSRLAYIDHFDLDFSFCHESAKYVDLPLKHGPASAGAFATAVSDTDHLGPGRYEIMVVGGDYQNLDASDGTSVLISPKGSVHSLFPSKVTMTTPKTPLHGYRSAVAYNAVPKTWITVGPNGTDISVDDGKNWKPLTPTKDDAPDADKNWNALSLPFVVGPKGRIGVIKDGVLKSQK
jgi:photosystem II stability/assembly factor-like uncharacterized protein